MTNHARLTRDLTIPKLEERVFVLLEKAARRRGLEPEVLARHIVCGVVLHGSIWQSTLYDTRVDFGEDGYQSAKRHLREGHEPSGIEQNQSDAKREVGAVSPPALPALTRPRRARRNSFGARRG